MASMMGNEEFRTAQWDQRFAPHVAAINELVDTLRPPLGSGPASYVAPHQGGSSARVVSVLSNPGPKASHADGSGFISCENADATAERICLLYFTAGIDQSLTVPWNAYPWYMHDDLAGKGLTAGMRSAGVSPMKKFLDLVPDASVVILHGRDAQDTWSLFEKVHPDYAPDRGIRLRRTWHTGNRAMASNREQRMQDLADTYAWAAQRLGL